MTEKSGEMWWWACVECGWRARMAFYAPSTVYCEGCGRKLGETDQSVESDFAALAGDVVIDADSGETLAEVEYIQGRVKIHIGGEGAG